MVASKAFGIKKVIFLQLVILNLDYIHLKKKTLNFEFVFKNYSKIQQTTIFCVLLNKVYVFWRIKKMTNLPNLSII